MQRGGRGRPSGIPSESTCCGLKPLHFGTEEVVCLGNVYPALQQGWSPAVSTCKYSHEPQLPGVRCRVCTVAPASTTEAQSLEAPHVEGLCLGAALANF